MVGGEVGRRSEAAASGRNVDRLPPLLGLVHWRGSNRLRPLNFRTRHSGSLPLLVEVVFAAPWALRRADGDHQDVAPLQGRLVAGYVTGAVFER
jgi:hypothetical protein